MVNTTLSPMVLEHAQQYYDQGHSLRETQKEFNISRPTLIRHLKTRSPKNISDEERRKRSVNKVVRWRRRAKQILVDYKGGKCIGEGCGYNRCLDNLTFHHLDPSKKDFQISGSTKSIETLKKEVDKCVLLCKNCHGEVHAGMRTV